VIEKMRHISDLALLDEAVDIIRQWIAPGFMAREPHLAIDIDIKHTAG
jgi:hypothetical protein